MILVGRVAERSRLRRVMGQPEPGLVLIVGPPGVGKSTLLAAAIEEIDGPVWTGQSVPGLSWKPYLPLAQACKRQLHGSPVDVAGHIAAVVGHGVLIIDDVQWCDPESLDAIEELSGRIRVCCAGRSGAATVERLRGLAGPARLVEVSPLSSPAAASLLTELRPGLPQLEIDRIVAHTAGNPLLLELAAAASPETTEAADVLRAEVTRLAPEEQRALARIHLGAGGGPAPRSDPAARSLLTRGLVVEDGPDLRVRHDLIAEAVLDVLDAETLRDVRLEVAERTADPGIRARCLAAAGRVDEARRAALEAGDTAASPHERADHLILAADLADDAALHPVEAAEAALEATRDEDAVRLLERSDLDELDIRALLVLAQASWSTGRFDLATAACERGMAVAHGTDPAAEARFLALRARVKGRAEWDGAAALSLAHQAAALCEQHDLALPQVYGALATASLVAGTNEWRSALHRAIDHASTIGDNRTLVLSLDTLFFAELMQGDPSRCAETAERGLAICTDLGWSLLVAHMRKNLLLARYHVEGSLREVIDEARALRERPLHARTRDHLDAHLALALADVGEVAAAEATVQESPSWQSPDPTTQAMIHWAAAEVHWAAGRWHEACEAAAGCRTIPALGFPAGDLVEPIRQWACIDLDQDPGPPLPEPGFANVRGAQLESSAIVALATGDPSSDPVQQFLKAADAWAPVSFRGALRCRWGAGFAASRRDQHARARQLLEPLAADLEADGRLPLLRRSRAALRRVGVRLASTGPAVGPFTGAEAEILRLVAQGRDSLQIARRLQLSRSTVDSTIRSAMRRIGASNRITAALRLIELSRSPDERRSDHLLLVTSNQEAARDHAARLDAQVLDIDGLERANFDLGTPARVLVAEITHDRDVARVLLAAARGAHVVAVVADDEPRRAVLLDGLRRIGPVQEVDAPPPALDADLRHALHLLNSGRSVADAARELGWSKRSLYRHLAQARATYGVTTNAELLLTGIQQSPRRSRARA